MLQPFPGTDIYETHVKKLISEEEWLEKYTHAGDASKLVLNLTEMTDKDFKFLLGDAERKLRKRLYSRYLKYYSLTELPERIIIDLSLFLRKKLLGINYETP